MVITISRQYGAGGSEVARLVAARLGWSVVDNEIIDRVAERANLSPVEHAVRGLVYLCDGASDDLIGTDVSMRDEPFRQRIGLA